jgi:uncharacterized protein (TIGR03437 family)
MAPKNHKWRGCARLFPGFAWFLAGSALPGQQYIISTIAGGAPPATPAAALNLSTGPTSGVAGDAQGNIYFVALSSVFKMDGSGTVNRIAGDGRPGFSGDGGPGINSQLDAPNGIAVDADGNIFIADAGNSRIRRVAANGIITTVAGNGVSGSSGDGGPATNAALAYPVGVAVDNVGHLWVADTTNNTVRLISGGVISTVAGASGIGNNGFRGDGGLATSAALYHPTGVAVDGSGNIYISDSGNFRVREVTTDGLIHTIAGSGGSGYSGDGGPATSAQLSPNDVALDGSGNLLIADLNGAVRFVSSNGNISTSAGTGVSGYSGDGGAATAATLNKPLRIAVDAAGNLFIADSANYRVRTVSSAGMISTVAGTGNGPYSGDNGPATSAQFGTTLGVAADANGNVFVADYDNHRVRKISSNGIVTTVAGNGTPGFSGDGGPALSAQLWNPRGVAADGTGNLYIADYHNGVIRKVTAGGQISTVAGGGTSRAEGGLATDALLGAARGVSIDAAGNLFVAGTTGAWAIGPNGTVTWFVTFFASAVAADGTGGAYFASDNASPSINDSLDVAHLSVPSGTVTGQTVLPGIQVVAGEPGCGPSCGSTGDGGPGTSATLRLPEGVALDNTGQLFIADENGAKVRKLSVAGIITTFAGTGYYGYSGDGGTATGAQLGYPTGVAVDGSGNAYIADGNGSVRKATPTSQAVLISAVVDAASESATAISPGKIVVIYGAGLGPATGVLAAPSNGAFGAQLAGTTVSIDGLPAPVYYASATQVNAIVPYGISGTTASVSVTYQSNVSASFSVPVAASSPGFFSYNSTGAGQAAVINDLDGSLNTAVNPAKVGDYVSFYATGEGQTTPAGVDGKLATLPLPSPNLPVSVTIGGLPAVVQYSGGVYGAVAGLMQVNAKIPAGVAAGAYVPVVLKVGNASTVDGALWIAVSN